MLSKLFCTLVCCFFLFFIQSNNLLAQTPYGAAQNTPYGENQPMALDFNWLWQVETGIVFVGYHSDFFYQFTGFKQFDDGASPQSRLTNLDVSLIKSLPFKYFQALGIKLSYAYFNTSSSVVLNGKSALVPKLEMNMHKNTLNFRFYLFSPKTDHVLLPFVSFGWGALYGNFKGTDIYRVSLTNSFIGMITEQSIGLQLPIYIKKFGFNFELMNTYARKIRINNNHFEVIPQDDKYQNKPGETYANLSGFTIIAQIYYNFL